MFNLRVGMTARWVWWMRGRDLGTVGLAGRSKSAYSFSSCDLEEVLELDGPPSDGMCSSLKDGEEVEGDRRDFHGWEMPIIYTSSLNKRRADNAVDLSYTESL